MHNPMQRKYAAKAVHGAPREEVYYAGTVRASPAKGEAADNQNDIIGRDKAI